MLSRTPVFIFCIGCLLQLPLRAELHPIKKLTTYKISNEVQRTPQSYNSDVDEQSLEALKIDAEHNLNRLQNYSTEVRNNRIYDEQREKALGEFLEDQEKWEVIRERGLAEYRKEKREDAAPSENSEAYREDQQEKKAEAIEYEHSRELEVRAKQKVKAIINREELGRLEDQELGLKGDRPRYSLEKRAHNKWVAKGSGRGNSYGGGMAPQPADSIPDYSNISPAAPAPEFPPVSDFQQPPAPYEGYDDSGQQLPPAYDGMPPAYDPSYGGDNPVAVPPPPPPPPDFDF